MPGNMTMLKMEAHLAIIPSMLDWIANTEPLSEMPKILPSTARHRQIDLHIIADSIGTVAYMCTLGQ